MRASGSEFEAGLGFSGLHQLLLPALGLLAHLPTQLRDALEVALTLRSGPPPERFAVGVATLSLLSRYAEDRPLLMLIDDADTPAKWYYKLKAAYLTSVQTGTPLDHPLKDRVTLRWRS